MGMKDKNGSGDFDGLSKKSERVTGSVRGPSHGEKVTVIVLIHTS